MLLTPADVAHHFQLKLVVKQATDKFFLHMDSNLLTFLLYYLDNKINKLTLCNNVFLTFK